MRCVRGAHFHKWQCLQTNRYLLHYSVCSHSLRFTHTITCAHSNRWYSNQICSWDLYVTLGAAWHCNALDQFILNSMRASASRHIKYSILLQLNSGARSCVCELAIASVVSIARLNERIDLEWQKHRYKASNWIEIVLTLKMHFQDHKHSHMSIWMMALTRPMQCNACKHAIYKTLTPAD